MQPQNQYAAPAPTSAPAENPGKTFGIVSLVTSLVGLSLIGLIFGILGLRKSKQAGQGNGLALAGTIIGGIGIVIGIIVAAVLIFAGSSVINKCQELGPGTHIEDGVTYTCS